MPIKKKAAKTKKKPVAKKAAAAAVAAPAAPKPAVTPRANKLELFLRSIKEQYPNDPTAPGMVISAISPAYFYVSVVRYTQGGGHGKVVVTSATGSNLLSAFNALLRYWRVKIAPPAQTATKAILDWEADRGLDDFVTQDQW
jgi:hypothetical protein